MGTDLQKQIEQILVKHATQNLIKDIRPCFQEVAPVDDETSDAVATLFAHILHDWGTETKPLMLWLRSLPTFSTTGGRKLECGSLS